MNFPTISVIYYNIQRTFALFFFGADAAFNTPCRCPTPPSVDDVQLEASASIISDSQATSPPPLVSLHTETYYWN